MGRRQMVIVHRLGTVLATLCGCLAVIVFCAVIQPISQEPVFPTAEPPPPILACTVAPLPGPPQREIRPPAPEPGEAEPRAKVWVRDTDGAEMVFVPAGAFLMGCDSGSPNESPQHGVYVYTFWIDRYEVTNQQYNTCVEDGYCAPSRCPDDDRVNEPSQPVVCVTWRDAVQYARWAGGRLPTEAEWEKAARGADGREYPWGDRFDAARCNHGLGGFNVSVPPAQYSPQGDSPYGVANMAGNVSEWTSSLYSEYPYDPDDGREDSESEEARVVRGGSSYSDLEWFFRCAYRNWAVPDGWLFCYGFRVAVSPGPPD